MYRSALGSSVVSNIAFPSQPDENGHNDENSVYTFNFPKNGVFVFNNPTILNLGEKGKEIELAQWLSDLWKDLKTENVWQDWPIGGKVAGLTTKSGAIDNSPLLNYLRGIASSFPDFKRRVTLSAVEVETG